MKEEIKGITSRRPNATAHVCLSCRRSRPLDTSKRDVMGDED